MDMRRGILNAHFATKAEGREHIVPRETHQRVVSIKFGHLPVKKRVGCVFDAFADMQHRRHRTGGTRLR